MIPTRARTFFSIASTPFNKRSTTTNANNGTAIAVSANIPFQDLVISALDFEIIHKAPAIASITALTPSAPLRAAFPSIYESAITIPPINAIAPSIRYKLFCSLAITRLLRITDEREYINNIMAATAGASFSIGMNAKIATAAPRTPIHIATDVKL